MDSKKYIALTIVIILLAGGAYASQRWFAETVLPAQEKISVVSFMVETEGTVLDAMHAETEKGSLSFSGRDFPGLGYFVEEINGKRNDDGYYWILRVNGELSQLGVSQARVSPGDTVEWRYEKGY